MSAALSTADRLEADAAFLKAHGRHETAASLRLIAAGASLEDAFSLRGTWRGLLAQRDQDRALRAILETLPPETSDRAAGRVLEDLLLRFQRSNRPDDRAGFRGAMADYLAAGGSMKFDWLRKCEPVRAWVSKNKAHAHAAR